MLLLQTAFFNSRRKTLTKNNMKKLTLTIVCALAVNGAAFAQGTLAWYVITPAAMTAQTNSTTCSPLFGGGPTGGGAVGATATAAAGFYYELLYNTSFTGSQVATPDFATLFGGTWLDTGLTATNAVASAGKLVPVAGNTGATVPWSQGTTNNIMLVGWSANLGTSWSVVSNELANWPFDVGIPASQAFFGESATGFLSPGAGNPGAAVFGTTAGPNGLPINSLNTQLYLLPLTPTPEPSTIALAGLGGLSLLLFRRRKQ